jgi:nucleoid-associated protein YgaU
LVVTAGDSLWQIAKDKLGNPVLFRELMAQNRQKVDDPPRLNTLMPITIKPF